MALATSAPQSASTIASAMSIPVVTPAEVQILPSTTYKASGSTVMPGYSAVSALHASQCVATRRPSINPSAQRGLFGAGDQQCIDLAIRHTCDRAGLYRKAAITCNCAARRAQHLD